VKLIKQIKNENKSPQIQINIAKKFKNNSTGVYANLALTKKNKQKCVWEFGKVQQ